MQLDSKHSQIQSAAIGALQQIADPVAVPDLAKRLSDRRTSSSAYSAIRAFGYLAEPELIPLLKSRDRVTQSYAVNLLGSVGGEKSLSALRSLASNGNLRSGVEKAMKEITERAGTPVLPRYLPTSTVDQIVTALKSERSSDIERALNRVTEINVIEGRRKEVVDALEALYTSSSRGVPEDAVVAVGTWGTSENVSTLLKRLDDTKDFPREATYRVLAEFGDAKAIAPLVARLETNDSRILQRIIPRFGSAAEPELLRLYESTSNASARDSAIFLLGEVGTEASLRILEPLAEESGAQAYRARLAVEKIQARSG